MKNLIKISVLALAATALMVSCTRETNFEEQSAAKVVRTFTCTFAQPDTKVAVGEGANLGKTTWEVGDEIMIHGGAEGAARQKVTLTAADISADGKKATISFEMDPYDRTDAGVVSKYYAQYPASLVPEGNMYYECRFTATNDFLMAACDVEDTFVFYNLCGVISYKVTGDFDKVAFVGNNEEVVGYSTVYQVRVRLDNGKDAPSVNYNKPGNGSGNPVPMKAFEAPVKLDGVNYIFLPAGTNFTGGFTFKFYKGEEMVKIATSTTAVEVKPSQILDLGDITAKLEDYVAPVVSDHKSEIPVGSASDLSVGGVCAANCYVLSAPGTYKFPAVKGNSADAVGNVFGVELVWETYNTEAEVTANSVIAKVDFEDNWIYFQTPATLHSGNALIAAKDSEGKIIWNWHIWIPEDTVGTFNEPAFYTQPVMDRNLGAMVKATTTEATVKTYGLYYQWGRKDPFTGGTAVAISGTAMTVVDGPKPLAFATQNPTTFIKVDESDSGGNWCDADMANLWDNDGAKSVYDPCPYGYQLPAYDETLAIFARNNDGWTYVWDANYFAYGDYVFPISGWLNGGEAPSYIGSRAIITSRKAHSTPRASLKIVRQDKGGFYYHNYFKQEATPVRCVSDGSVAPVPAPDVAFAIDGDYSEWANVESLSHDGGVKAFKVGSDADNMYFYLEVDKSVLSSEAFAYAHYLTLYIDNGDGEGEKTAPLWNSAKCDKYWQFWTMSNGAPKISNWSFSNLQKKASADGDLYKYEWSFERAAHAALAGKTIKIGMYINGQTVDTSSGSEVWGGSGDSLGASPAADADMVLIALK